jgi:hypothetical protein
MALGELSNNHKGTIKTTIEFGIGRDPDFALRYLTDGKRNGEIRRS